MKRVFLILSLMTVVFLDGCADDLSPEVKDRPPGAYSPNVEANLPVFHDTSGRL